MNVLVSSAGRRGALVQLIRDTISPQGGRVFAIDVADWSSACRLADGWQRVPPFAQEESFFNAVAGFCQEHRIELIIPTHDRELPVYARLRNLFAELGIHVACSGAATVAIAADKWDTYEFLTQHGLPTVLSWLPDDLRASPRALTYPLIVKPRCGSGSTGVHMARDADELAFYMQRTDQPIVQTMATGREFTVNVFVRHGGSVAAAVPHWRVETRGGEVSKGITVRNETLIGMAHDLVKSLPDAHGPFCFQAFLSDDGAARIIEINARLGGGYPIAHHAGANFVQLMIDQLKGIPSEPPVWQDGVAMTRWEDAVFWDAGAKTCA